MRGLVAILIGLSVSVAQAAPPNIVVIFIDDMGYADIGPFGATAYKTPNLDKLAQQGRVFTDFHSATAVCSASRAALMTGCYPERVSILGALQHMSRHGINASETTLAEVCKQRGYATAIFGKWHLGHHRKFLPLQHGFDEFYGLPYSNDMWPLHPDFVKLPPDEAGRKRGYPPLVMFDGNEVADDYVDADDQTQLTTQYTEHAVDFIQRRKSQPFLLYVPHSMVHVPLYVSDKFKDQSGAGLFGDVVMEVDWSVGQIMAALDEAGVADNTLVIFTTDNGPWLNYGEHAGSAGPLREGKGTMWEGGYRVPCVMRWPGIIPAGTKCDELASTMDVVPTIANELGVDLPNKVDGHDIKPLMTGDAPSPWETFYCYYDNELRAVRDRQFKLVLPHQYRTLNGRPGGKNGGHTQYEQATTGEALYDLKADVGETTDVAAQHPEVVERLRAAAEQARSELGDTLTKRKGSEIRQPGRLGKQAAAG